MIPICTDQLDISAHMVQAKFPCPQSTCHMNTKARRYTKAVSSPGRFVSGVRSLLQSLLKDASKRHAL